MPAFFYDRCARGGLLASRAIQCCGPTEKWLLRRHRQLLVTVWDYVGEIASCASKTRKAVLIAQPTRGESVGFEPTAALVNASTEVRPRFSSGAEPTCAIVDLADAVERTSVPEGDDAPNSRVTDVD